MKPSIDAILAAIAIQELDRIKGMEQVPTLEALLVRLERRRPEIELASDAIAAFLAGGEA